MTPVKSFMTVKLGEGAKVQFPEAVLNTGYAGATIQFGTIFEVMQFQQSLPENTVSAPTVKGAAEKPSVEEKAPKRASVFTRLSITSAPAPTIQKEISDPKLKPTIVNSTGQNIIPEEVPAENVTEIPDASPKLSRKARRKANARLRANGWMPNTLQEPSLQLEANVPTNNGFEPLKWVKRNDDKGKLKKSFWENSHQQSLPPKKEESASSKIYKILKAVKDRNLQRRLRKSVNEHFEAHVEEHFAEHALDILIACKAYMDGARVGSYGSGMRAEDSRKNNSAGFRIMLAKILPMLVSSFAAKGIDCSQFINQDDQFPGFSKDLEDSI
ncbi:hypothetical protein M5K25_021336 [Dendrobium thyrsiflorum]|uniref:Uncharacterized protein n=1 Tax=Dendrobium thyrsiflorum TaxID=117978 RepID=A0ABD0UC51_DENTH